ncbi:MAG: rhomboid family intramembrane serine protease, partial [Thiohalomonadales bacterium]
MLILPYSTALRLNQIPYVTLTVILLSIMVFFFQLNNYNVIESAVNQYCVSIQDNTNTENEYDYMPQNIQYCFSMLFYMHSLKDINDWKEIYLGFNDSDDDNKELQKFIPADLKRYQDFLSQGVPANLDVKLMYYPDTLNPFKMLTSTIAHADWSHIIFNLIFFLAFTPALELLVGNKIKFVAVLVLISFVTGIFYSISSLINGQFIPTLGLSGVVT